MVIHDFAHTKMPYFSIGKSKRFGWIIFLLSCTGIEYKLPGRHVILGDLLDINYKRYSYKKSQYLIKAADTFGIYFIGDGDSIEKKFHLSILFDPYQIQQFLHSILWTVPTRRKLEKNIPHTFQTITPLLAKALSIKDINRRVII